MKQAVPFATLVVSRYLSLLFRSTNAFFNIQHQLYFQAYRRVGLYHKLHGSHRPVGMKKSTIKRRKRVVPALQDSSSIVNLSSDCHGATPFTVTQQLRDSRPPPPAVDFTGYNSFQHTPSTSQSSHLPQSQSTRPRKKRSVSSMSQASESSANQPTNDESPVDPSLLALSQRAHQNQSQARAQPPRTPLTEQDENESRKAERRAQLAREAEQMRELLMAKEKELAELA